ncbi:MAG: phenylacetic acid degradation bifunctional protein PaaZ [Pseudomonadota bacterium]
MQLENYALGEWVKGQGQARPLINAVTGETIASSDSTGLDFAQMAHFARNVGGPALRAMTFHQRALMLKALAKYLMEHKAEFYGLSTATGATKRDSWIDIDGGISTLFVYSSKGRRELPDQTFFIDGDPEQISRHGTFTGQHICVPLEGVAIHINAYNFPCWGMLEKLAPTLLAGVPAIVKPATSTSYLTELMFKRMVDSKLLPAGAIQLVCGGVGNLFDSLTCQDSIAFTGSAVTAQKLIQHPRVISQSVRFTAETDSLNCSILGPDAKPGSEEFNLYIKEVVQEMSVKAGQKCTAIRRCIVPNAYSDAVAEAIQKELGQLVVGHPEDKNVAMGPLASLDQRSEVRERVQELQTEAELVFGNPDTVEAIGADAEKGAFVSPMLLRSPNPLDSDKPHSVEAFGPVSTLMSYDNLEEAIALAKRGEGSLAGSIVSYDDNAVRELVLGTAAYHGRLVLINRDCAKESTGHGSPLPHLIHGGPGRAGGGEEMGGIRGVMHYMQRCALQGSPKTISHTTAKWMNGARQVNDDVHPFRKRFSQLEVGDTLVTEKRTITLEDIENFAHLSGDHFYAHMDQAAAEANPFFEGRVAHGYFLVSAAAGLFVQPDPGPVLANYGLDNLRFTQPVYPGDAIQVRLTCKQKTPRSDQDYGEIRWDVDVTNQEGESVAAYDVLTMVAN